MFINIIWRRSYRVGIVLSFFHVQEKNTGMLRKIFAFAHAFDNMEQHKKVAAALVVLAMVRKRRNVNKRRQRTIWIRSWLANRQEKSAHNNILAELRLTDGEHFRKYLRMNTETYQELLESIRPYITKQMTPLRKPISPEEQLAVTIRYLASGESMESLMYQYRIHSTTIGLFVQSECYAIVQVLVPRYMKIPGHTKEWHDLVDETFRCWQFPNCFAAVDGKHIGVVCPPDSGSDYFNYKRFYSVVLLAFVDYDYRFLIAKVGAQGRLSDGGIFRNSDYTRALKSGQIKLPDSRKLPRNPDPF